MKKKNNSSKSKILTSAQLKKRLKKLKSGSITVFTNGCFDILHVGHLSYLEKTKSLGTHLIVALNTDRSVRHLKGKKRPINCLKDRMTVIAGLECVNFVTSFDDDTPLELIKILRPDVLAKGADYKISEIVGAKEVLGYGGVVKRIPFVKGYSTTKILSKI